MGLLPDTPRGVNQQHGHIAIGCGNGHVARVLLVTGGIGDKYSSTVGQIHVAVGHVDGDALLALGFESVGQQRIVDLPHRNRGTATSRATGVIKLVRGHASGFCQQATDERRLTVIDRAACDQVKDRNKFGGHQK